LYPARDFKGFELNSVEQLVVVDANNWGNLERMNELKDRDGVDGVFGVFQLDSHSSIVIARSGHRDLDVGQVILALGGGGHPAAGSAMIKSGDVGGL
jgi:hypothetical protein